MTQVQQGGAPAASNDPSASGVSPRMGYNGYTDSRPADDGGGDGEIGLQQLVGIITRQWKLLTAIALGCLLLAVGATFLLTPTFTATAVIKLDPSAEPLFSGSEQQKQASSDQSVLDTETAIIQSRAIARQVIQSMKLDQMEEFRPRHPERLGSPEAIREAIVDSFLKQLVVKRDTGNYLINVGFTTKDGERSALIANAVSDAYIASSISQRTQSAKAQAEWLTQRLQTLSGEVQKSENLAAQYKARAGIAESTGLGTVTDQQVGPTATLLAQTQQEEQAAKAELAAARAQVASGNAGSVSGVLSSPVIADLRRQRAEASKSLADVRTRYGPKHPEYQRVTEEIADYDRAINEETTRIISGLEAKARSTAAQAAALRSNLGQIKSEKSRNAEAAAYADAYDRDAKAKQTAYEELAHKLEQVSQAQHNELPTAVIVERAVAPALPTFPNVPLFAALGLVLGLLIGFTVILVRDLFNATIRFSEDLNRATGGNFIVSVPEMSKRELSRGGVELAPADLIVSRPVSAYTEAFRTIRSTIRLHTPRPPQVVAVLSALPAEGKSTVAMSLARVMGANSDKVILVDCDVRRGRVASLAGIAPDVGTVEVLEGQCNWRDAVVRHEDSNLDMIPVTSQKFTTNDLFSGERMRELIAQLRAEYEFIVLDTPPLLAVSDARMLASLADGSIFVAASKRTPRRAAAAAIDFLRSDQSILLGTVLSMVDKQARRGSRKDPSYYYEEYARYVEATA